MSIVALHEAAHAVVAARMPGTIVIHATIAADEPHVRTRVFMGRAAEDRIIGLKRLAVIDLAGAAVEDDLRSAAAETDRENAWRRCLEIATIEPSGGPHRLDHEQRAARLYEYQFNQAGLLVERRWSLIEQVADRLRETGMLSGIEVAAMVRLFPTRSAVC